MPILLILARIKASIFQLFSLKSGASKQKILLQTYILDIQNEIKYSRLRGQNQNFHQNNDNYSKLPVVSIITPSFRSSKEVLRKTIQSVIQQEYSNWELCIACGGSTEKEVVDILKDYEMHDQRIRVHFLGDNLGISGNSNEAINLSKGDYLAILDHDDLLEPNALSDIIRAIEKHSHGAIFYSDRDYLTGSGTICHSPFFKPSWSPDILLSANYLAHLVVLRKDVVDEVGYFNPEMDGAQDWDLFLRVSEQKQPIIHIPGILYHWRQVSTSYSSQGDQAKPYVKEAQKKALIDHFKRANIPATPEMTDYGSWRLWWTGLKYPRVSIILTSQKNNQDPTSYIEPIAQNTDYKDLEFIFGGTWDSVDLSDYPYPIYTIKASQKPSLPALLNKAVSKATGEFLLIMNENQIQPLSKDWLKDLAGWVSRSEIGAAGPKLLTNNHRIAFTGYVIGLKGRADSPFRGLFEGMETPYGSSEWYRNYCAISSTALMIRRDLFLDYGGFDTKYEKTGFDIDLCLKCIADNKRIVYDPFSRLVVSHPVPRLSAQDFCQLKNNPLFTKYLLEGDPYFNPYLSLKSTIPRIKIN